MNAPARAAVLGVAVLLAHCGLTPTDRLLNQGDGLYEDGDLDGAAQRYARVLDSHPRNPHALYGIGLVHYTRGEYRQALSFFDRAVEQSGENAAYRMQRGHTLLRLKSFERAIEDYEAVIQLDPARVEAYYSIGIAHYNARDYADAVRWLKRYLALAPKSEDRSKIEQLIHSLREWSRDVFQTGVSGTA
jgi:tetratricopeptide (TPR) repeat protein